jgi:hypothetical protein
MKLDSTNVLRGIFQALMREPAPLNEIDGVKCVVDFLDATVKIGEDREQAWFEVALFDVTPRRFLSRDEQLDMNLETEEWWNVTSPKRMAFVRAKSRSKAMQYFAAKFHETATDCELARGFEFVDPTKEELPEELPPAPGFELDPVGPTMGCPHAGKNHSCGDEVDDEDGDESGDGDGLRPDEEEPHGMRVVVDFPITDADDEMRLEHPDEFEFDAENRVALDAIQEVVDEWEAKGVTIDQGGDAGHYELGLEGCEALELDATLAQAKQILDDVARALRDAGIPSAPAIPDDPEPSPEAKGQEEPKEGHEEAEEADGEEFDDSKMKPEDFYFGVGDAGPQGGGKWLTICPKKYWNENHTAYDEHINAEHLFPGYLQYPDDAECLWSIPEDKQTEDVAIDMSVLGFERNLELEE